MNYIDRLVREYENFVALPWQNGLAGPQRVWFVVYDRAEERRLRARLDEFKLATQRHKHKWAICDLTDTFAHWMAGHKYRDAYFAAPKRLSTAPLKDFRAAIAETVRKALRDADENTVVGLSGVGSLFGFMRTSELMEDTQNDIKGRLAVFFPGQHENNTYRLLDARDGWNYLAVPITAYKGAGS